MAPIDVEAIPQGSKLELYISPDCPYCHAAMEHYDEVGTRYIVQTNGLIQASGGKDYLPGDQPGSAATGGLYTGSD